MAALRDTKSKNNDFLGNPTYFYIPNIEMEPYLNNAINGSLFLIQQIFIEHLFAWHDSRSLGYTNK